MTIAIVRNLVPSLLIAGTALGFALRQVRQRRPRREPDISLGRAAFATHLVGSRTRRRQR